MRGVPARPGYRHPTDTRPLEVAGPRRLTRQAWRLRYQRKGRPWPPATRYRPFLTAAQVELLQALADGADRHEIARREHCSWEAVERHIRAIRFKLGAHTVSAAIAQGLKRGIIRPDTATWRRVRRADPDTLAHAAVRDVIGVMRGLAADGDGAAPQPRPQYRAVRDPIVQLHARTVPHAMSILWAAGAVTSAHVAQTRSVYRHGRGKNPTAWRERKSA